MKNVDFKYLCTIIGNLAGIPIRVYQNGKQVFYHSYVNLPVDPIELYIKEILEIEEHIGYFITPYFDYYGVVNSSSNTIIIGPTRQTTMKEQDIKELAFQCDVDINILDEFIIGLKSIVAMPLSSIIQILCTINYVLNEEKLSLEDIAIHEAEQQNLKYRIELERSNQNFDYTIENTLSQQPVHNTLTLEQTITNMIQKGDTAALREWISNAPAVRGGTLAADQLRQLKNTFIVTATLVSRAAIYGGMDVNDSLLLSDNYIQKCELLSSVDKITNLQYHMVIDYAEQVEKIRHGKTPSKLVIHISNYIQHHLSEPISIEELSKAMFLSRTHLSAKFKKEAGMTLTDFILKEKTEEAKRLLRFTDKSLSAISIYLGFSSQSHFSNVFRKYTKKSPVEYRKNHDKIKYH